MSQTYETVREIEAYAKERMEKAVADLQHETTTLRTGRASVNLLEPVHVEAYGSPMPLNHVATLHVPEPSLITVQPFDVSLIGAIDKAIRNAGLGLNPSNDGKIVRVPIPPLNEERRKEFVKKLHGMAEDHRVSLRNIRRDANDNLKKILKDKLISEDEDRRAHDEIQKMTDAYIAKIDAVAKAKEKEIMEVK
jgi:ribosome recycling factor